jgi:hypothetical protein
MSKHPLSSKKHLLLTDLDSTVIFSHRHEHDDSCVWVEELNGKRQSFMTPESYRFYETQTAFDVVPLTTRNLEPYARLQGMTEALGWHDALICNGSILLHDLEEDLTWRAESERMVQPYLDELLELRAIAESVAGAEFVRYTEPFMFYVRGENANAACPLMQAKADPERFIIHEYTRKVYCIPRIFNKGASAERYQRTFGYPAFLAAGDSLFDLPMLERAKVGFCPEPLFEKAPEQDSLCACPEPFPDSVCAHLERIAARAES